MRPAALAAVLMAWMSTAAQAADEGEPRLLMRDAAMEQADKMPCGDGPPSETAVGTTPPVEAWARRNEERAAHAASAEAHLAAIAAAHGAAAPSGNGAAAVGGAMTSAAALRGAAADAAQHGVAAVARERAASAGSDRGRGPASVGRARP